MDGVGSSRLMRHAGSALTLFLFLCFAPSLLCHAAGPVPLAARFGFQPSGSDARRFHVEGLPSATGRLEGEAASISNTPHGLALVFADPRANDKGHARAIVENLGQLDKIGRQFTVTAWVLLDELPASNKTAILAKRSNGNRSTPIILGVDSRGRVVTEGDDGTSWSGNLSSSQADVRPGVWTHIAFSWQPGGEAVQYVDGHAVGRKAAARGLQPTTEPLVFGWDDNSRTPFRGKIADVRFYAAALTADQVQADRSGTLETRAATEADFPKPTLFIHAHLTRFDTPEPFRNLRDGDFDAVAHEPAQRRDGPDAVDWPDMTVAGKRLFERGSDDFAELPLWGFRTPQMASLFRQPTDSVIQPGDHWLRALVWYWNQKQVYTTDVTANGYQGDYELTTFPVRIQGKEGHAVQSVALTYDGRVIYRRDATNAPLHSLTLLLPGDAPEHPYQLTVDGETTPVHVGLEPIMAGHPDAQAVLVQVVLPNGISVTGPSSPGQFPYRADWDKDTAAMLGGSEIPLLPLDLSARPWWEQIGVEVPRSPVTVNGEALRDGMSAGWFYNSPHIPGFAGTVDQYAAFLATQGFDRLFEQNSSLDDPAGDRSFDHLMAALGTHKVGGGISMALTNHPNVALFSYTLPQFLRPSYRDFQVTMQRLRHYPNFVGTVQGADNAGYVPYWDWAGPIMNRPWGRAMSALQGADHPAVPVGPGLRPQKDYEKVGTQRQFLDYIHHYNQTFGIYGTYDHAVREVDANLIWCSGSFGSGPGGGGRGGWPWASIPGEAMYRDVTVQQAYDWDETLAAKPLHNLSLVDRLRSAYPDKITWTVIDDFRLHYGRQARERAYALSLTRGVQAVGTNFLAHPGVADPTSVQDYRDLFAWVHRYGGAYAQMRSSAPIGILYVNDQSISRPILGDHDNLYKGAQEGKAVEALMICHAAGWPARLIMPEELERGALDKEIKVLLLVGLNRFDDTWVWYEGLGTPLASFVSRGGRILEDDESVAPPKLAAVKTGLHIAAYVSQSDVDQTPMLFARNTNNIAELRWAMAGVAAPVAVSANPTLWAVPSTAGTTRYVTVVNWGCEPGKNATKDVKPQFGELTWNTSRPIYDVRLGRRVTVAEARTVDLTHEGFQLYALPAAPVAAPEVVVSLRPDGRYQAATTILSGATLTGVPIELTVSDGSHSTVVATGTGLTAPLPLTEADSGAYTLTARELLSGRSSTVALRIPARGRRDAGGASLASPAAPDSAVARFLARRDVPLTIALTPQQATDPKIREIAKRLQEALRVRGRPCGIRAISPGDVVVSLQPDRIQERYPQWRTIDSDLILLGHPKDNLLLFDQARGYLFPESWRSLRPGQGVAWISYSPFIGQKQVLNIVAADVSGLTEAISRDLL